MFGFFFTMLPIYGDHFYIKNESDSRNAATNHMRRRLMAALSIAPLVIFTFSTRRM